MPHFNLEVCFLSGRYGGSEWPPAPMRLLQALVAGTRDGTNPALKWLEELDPPVILAEADPVGTTIRTFVPNNTAKGALATPTEKAIRDRQIRRPRATVRYCWRFNAADQPLATLASVAAERLHTLGTGHDMCSARAWVSDDGLISRDSERALWKPSPLLGISAGGVPLRVPVLGSLASIEARYQAGRQRFDSSAGFVPPVLAPAAFRSIEYSPSHQWPRLLAIPVRLVEPTSETAMVSWPHARTVHVGAMLRHGAMSALNNTQYADWAAGYAPDEDLDNRLSWVPLPSIGQHNADRRIRRAVFLARPDAQAGMEALYQALLADRITLCDKESGEVQAVARVADEQDQQGVFEHYKHSGRVWKTVTPIALPGDYATDARRTRRLVCKALAEASIDVGLVHSIEASRIPLHPKDPPLSAVSLKAWKTKSTPLVYCRIEFTEPLQGPLVIGRGRHYGLGLLCANPE